MADDYTVVLTDRMSGKVTRGGFSTLEQAERVANVWRQSASYFHVKIEVTRPSDIPEQEADMDDTYTVVVTEEDGSRLRYEFSTLEQAKRVASDWQTPVAGNPRVEIMRNLPGPSVVADRRRKIDWIKVGLVIAGVLAAITIVVAYFFANPILWDALVRFASHPFIVGNAVGLAVTGAGIAAARHLHNRSR